MATTGWIILGGVFLAGLILGYILFGRKKEVVYVNQGVAHPVAGHRSVASRGTVYTNHTGGRASGSGGSGSNLLGTAAAVTAGVAAGSLIADAVEDMVDGDMLENAGEVIEDVTDFVDDAVDSVDDIFE
ncbi:MAG: hypothetical protein PWP15_844 [Methanothermococcus sp.]|uniref:hypothetical protein n=1 Tax=Methanothermococcus TaxID=155862 RepID=UPI00035CA8E7|nr:MULTISPECIES: hypothetical protein [Methanothermococcus]MDK2790337.1 hypothetical protein [Methanothermococcus sp.]MDK2987696.1 hypothetical protein [Methanothermococcus sp.]